MKKVKRVRVNRRYSEEFKRSRVKDYESGEFTVLELGKLNPSFPIRRGVIPSQSKKG